MSNTFTVPTDGSYRCAANPLDGHSAITLLAVGSDGASVKIAEWAGNNPLCAPRGGTVEVFDLKAGTILKVDGQGAQLDVTSMQ
jgi:hypothetical protein